MREEDSFKKKKKINSHKLLPLYILFCWIELGQLDFRCHPTPIILNNNKFFLLLMQYVKTILEKHNDRVFELKNSDRFLFYYCVNFINIKL